MGTTHGSPRYSSTQIQVKNAEYSPSEQFVDKRKPLFKKINQKLLNDEAAGGNGTSQHQDGSTSKFKVEKDMEQVSISENDINGL